jgi:two-component system OmpR family response regulator
MSWTAMQKILVVVEHSPLRDVLRFALARDGYTVIEAVNGTQGLALVGAEGADLIILDIEMPEPDGIEVCRRLRLGGDSTPIIFLSSRDDQTDRIPGLEIGGDDHIGKPFSPREMISRVRSVLQRRTTATA